MHQLKNTNLTTDNIKTNTYPDGSTPEPAIWSCDNGQWIARFDSRQLTTTWMSKIRLRAPTLVESVIFHIGYPVVQTDGWKDGRKVTWLPKFLGRRNFLSYGARKKLREVRCNFGLLWYMTWDSIVVWRSRVEMSWNRGIKKYLHSHRVPFSLICVRTKPPEVSWCNVLWLAGSMFGKQWYFCHYFHQTAIQT